MSAGVYGHAERRRHGVIREGGIWGPVYMGLHSRGRQAWCVQILASNGITVFGSTDSSGTLALATPWPGSSLETLLSSECYRNGLKSAVVPFLTSHQLYCMESQRAGLKTSAGYLKNGRQNSLTLAFASIVNSDDYRILKWYDDNTMHSS